MKNFNLFNDLSESLKSTAVWVTTASIALVAFSLPNFAHAQDGAAGALLEEIVTTARKKSTAEAVQDVPVAVAAFGATQIDALFVKKVTDMSYLVPNVQMEEVGTFPGVQNFSFRGQGINSSIPSVDPTVGVFVDGVFLGTTYGVVMDTFDLESVEILRGPQGLLFGRNVTGGAVLLRNARPTGEFGARVRVGATDESQYNLAAAFEGSLIDDVLAAKIVAYYDDDDGYFDAPTVGRKVGKMRTVMLRPSLVWSPNDTTQLDILVEHGESDGDGAPWTAVSLQRAGVIPEFSTTLNAVGTTDIEWTQFTTELNVEEVGNGTLTNIAAYRRVDAFSVPDVDGIAVDFFEVPGSTDQKQFSNELRWNGNIRDNWETTLGLYFFDQRVSYREGRIIARGPLAAAGLPPNLVALGGDMDARNVGAFWSNDFFLNDSWTATLGVRYTDEKKSTALIDSSAGPCTDIVSYNCPFLNLSGDWDNITPKVGVQVRFGEASQAYAFYSKGFRSGGFNFRNARPNIIPPGPTREEENNTFEIGLKTTLRGGRVRMNFAAFQNEIDDMQRELNLPDAAVAVLQATVNAGDVTIKGVEFDFVALLADNFSINGGYGWQDGEYDRIDPLVAAIDGLLIGAGVLQPGQSTIGPELPRLAPTNWTFGASWDIPTGDSTFNIAANYSFREGHVYNDSNTERYEDAKRLNANVTWYSPGGLWDASVYGKNLTDEASWGNLTTIGSLGITSGPMQKGRVIGLEINYRTN